MSLILIIKLIFVIVSLVLFLRRPSLVGGIGLLSVTTAVLFDTFLGAFGRDEMLSELGFFFYVISGFLFAGATLWAWGMMQPLVGTAVSTNTSYALNQNPDSSIQDSKISAVDRKMLYDEIHSRLGREDILDLIFDLGLNENDVMPLNQNMNQIIINIMDLAAENGQTGALALAVERILTPPPPENLPRLEKIDADAPATILRHYLLAQYDLTQLQQIAASLNIDWEQLTAGSKQTKVRSLLLHLYRRNRIDELIEHLHETAGITP